MSIKDIRNKIDDIDLALLGSIAERMQQAKLMKLLKNPGEVVDNKREDELRKRWTTEAEKRGVSPQLALNILDLLITESRRLQSS